MRVPNEQNQNLGWERCRAGAACRGLDTATVGLQGAGDRGHGDTGCSGTDTRLRAAAHPRSPTRSCDGSCGGAGLGFGMGYQPLHPLSLLLIPKALWGFPSLPKSASVLAQRHRPGWTRAPWGCSAGGNNPPNPPPSPPSPQISPFSPFFPSLLQVIQQRAAAKSTWKLSAGRDLGETGDERAEAPSSLGGTRLPPPW